MSEVFTNLFVAYPAARTLEHRFLPVQPTPAYRVTALRKLRNELEVFCSKDLQIRVRLLHCEPGGRRYDGRRAVELECPAIDRAVAAAGDAPRVGAVGRA